MLIVDHASEAHPRQRVTQLMQLVERVVDLVGRGPTSPARGRSGGKPALDLFSPPEIWRLQSDCCTHVCKQKVT